MSAGSLQVDNIDVFCERGVFGLSSAHRILQAGRDMGLNINFHGDELHPMNSAQVSSGEGGGAYEQLLLLTRCAVSDGGGAWSVGHQPLGGGDG